MLDPENLGTATAFLRTERMVSGADTESAYRISPGVKELDAAEFEELVNSALRGSLASAAGQLTSAIALWRGRPLAESDDEHSAARARGWQALYLTALRELVRVHGELGRFELALPVAERLAADFPGIPEAAADLRDVRDRLRERHGDQVLRQDIPDLRTSVVIIRGDLFDQRDANLVIGFTDTFDVDMRMDLVISRASMQGQLVERLYGGNAATLDRELRRGLQAVAPVGRESSQAKRRGKRIRYPLGTVVAVPLNGRRVFAAAYSRLGNDLVARARAEDLAAALGHVWESVARYGQLAPVAVPLLGSGLSRIIDASPEQLISLIVASFISGCRAHQVLTPQLRIVLRPADLERVNMAQVAKEIAAAAR